MPSHTQQKLLSRKEQKKRDNNSPSFTWPEYILYEGRKVYASFSCLYESQYYIVPRPVSTSS